MVASSQEFVWEPGRTVPLTGILGVLRRGRGDPSMVISGRNLWWAPRTPQGPVASFWCARRVGDVDRVVVHAYGPGANWLMQCIPVILGEEDDVSAFRPQDELVQSAWSRPVHRDWRVAKTGLVMNSLIPTILEQKVTGDQAFGAFRRLVRAHGEPAAFPPDVIDQAGPMARVVAQMHVAPTVQAWRRIPSWQWLKAGVEPSASATVMRALEVAHALEGSAQLPLPEAHARLRSVPGIGVWTAAKVAQTALGDADAPTFADFHVAKRVGWAFDGVDGDDTRMAQILEPYRGHRYRAEHLILRAGVARESRGPRVEMAAHSPRWGKNVS